MCSVIVGRTINHKPIRNKFEKVVLTAMIYKKIVFDLIMEHDCNCN